MKCDFIVGQKIVCVHKKWMQQWIDTGYTLPVYGGQYTVREIAIYEYQNLDSIPFTDVGILLQEIKNPALIWTFMPYELGFHYRCFRPLDEKKIEDKKETGITLLKQFERPKPIKVPENV